MGAFENLMLESTIRSAMALAAAASIAVAMRRTSAARRHFIWLIGVLAALSMPALTWMLPAWRVLPAANEQVEVVTQIAPPAAPTPQAVRDAVGHASVSAGSDHPEVPDSVMPQMRDRMAESSAASRTFEPSAPAAAATGGWHSWIWILWGAGSAVTLLPLLVSAFSLFRLGRSSREIVDHLWLELLREIEERLGVRRRVILLQGSVAVMPMTWGAWPLASARILLPPDAEAWSADRRRSVLTHELAHVKRWDCLTQLLARLACVLWWFNALCWLAARRMGIERERACDDLVLEQELRAVDYAAHLVAVAAGPEAPRLAGVMGIAMARRRGLEARVREVLDGRRSRKRLTAAVLLTAMTIACVVVLPLATMRRALAQAPENHELTIQTPAGVSVHLVAIGDAAAGQWWAADGTPLDSSALPPETRKLAGKGVVLRIEPAEAGLVFEFHEGGYVVEPKRIEEAGSLRLVTTDLPANRSHGNAFVRATRAPWTDLYRVPLTLADGGKLRRVDQHGIEAVVDLKATAGAEFTATVLHNNQLSGMRFAAVDRSGRVHMPAGQEARLSPTILRFAFPLEELSALARQERTWEGGVNLKNIALRPGTPARPVVQRIERAAPDLEARLGARALYKHAVFEGCTIYLLAVGKLEEGKPTWWSPDGGPAAAVAGIVESDIDGMGTVLAFSVSGASFSPSMEINGRRERAQSALENGVDWVWVGQLKPSGRGNSGDLHLNLTGSSRSAPELVRVPITTADVEKSIEVNESGLRRISGLKQTDPQRFVITLEHDYRVNGFEFYAVDKAGKRHDRAAGGFSTGRAELTFAFPLQDLAAMIVVKTAAAEAWVRNISMAPGQETGVKFETLIKDPKPGPVAGPAETGEAVVLTPDGKPAAGAKLVACSTQRWTFVRNSAPRDDDRNLTVTMADGDGRISIAWLRDAHRVMAYHDSGWGIASLAELQRNGKVVLRPWGRVSGVIQRGGKPLAGASIAMRLEAVDHSEVPGNGGVELVYETQSDAEGLFTFDRVSPAQGTIGRDTITRQVGDSTHHAWDPSRGIVVESGKTTEVVLGGSGSSISGRFIPPAWHAQPIDWSWSSLSLSRKLPEPPRLPSSQQWGWWHTPDGRNLWRQRWSSGITAGKDGDFRFEDVPAGTYTLSFHLSRPMKEGQRMWHFEDIGHLDREVVIGGDGGNIDLGTVEVPLRAIP